MLTFTECGLNEVKLTTSATMQTNGYKCNEFIVSTQHRNDTQLQKPVQMHSDSLHRLTQTDGRITGYSMMLCYRNVLAGVSAHGGYRGSV